LKKLSHLILIKTRNSHFSNDESQLASVFAAQAASFSIAKSQSTLCGFLLVLYASNLQLAGVLIA
jgi:hypothetical protein